MEHVRLYDLVCPNCKQTPILWQDGHRVESLLIDGLAHTAALQCEQCLYETAIDVQVDFEVSYKTELPAVKTG